MKLAITAVILLAVAPVNAIDPYDFDSETTHRTVTWDDFKGDKGPQLGRWDSGSGARISTRIKLTKPEVEIEATEDGFVARAIGLEAYAVMDKFVSGVEPAARNDRVLAHEQLHFDLTEAIARRLNAALAEVEGVGGTEREAEEQLGVVVRELSIEQFEELGRLQAAYDGESRHGLSKKQQKAWARKIGAMLAESPG